MLELLKLLAIFAILGLILVAAWFVLSKLGLLKAIEGKEDREPPYLCRDRFLTPAEAAFHHDLFAALPILTASAGKNTPPLLFAKTRLADVLATDSSALKQSSDEDRSHVSKRTTAQNKINAKHVDFLLCHPETTRPLLVIELDDATHQRQDRRDRDELVDAACKAAALPVLHVKCRPPGTRYDPRQLAADMAAKLNG